MTRRDAGNVLPESSNTTYDRILYFISWCWFNQFVNSLYIILSMDEYDNGSKGRW